MAAWRRSLTVTVRASCALAASTVLPIAPPTTAPASAPVAVSQGREMAAPMTAPVTAPTAVPLPRCLLNANRRAAVDSAGAAARRRPDCDQLSRCSAPPHSDKSVTPSRTPPAQERRDTFEICERIHVGTGRLEGLGDMERQAVLERTQLLELLAQLERPTGALRELEQPPDATGDTGRAHIRTPATDEKRMPSS